MPRETISREERQTITTNLTRYVEASGMTMTDFAIAINVERATLSRYKSGKLKPSREKMIRMAEVLGKDVEEFYVNV